MRKNYTDAALMGFGSDFNYTNAALRGGGKRRKTVTKKTQVKGGIAISTALGLIPAAIKGAHLIYKGIKWLRDRKKGRGCMKKKYK